MNKRIKIGNGNVVTITDKMYKAAGGEGEIYVHQGMAFKLYFDPDHKMLPLSKMKELEAIGNGQIIIPKDIIYDATSGKPLGYTTKFVDNVEPLLKLFTRTFKDANNIDPSQIADLVKQMQLITADVHKASCLVVDYNELNVLVNVGALLVPWYIDTDSYATPSYKATAIMDSVRDRRVTVYDKNGVMHYNPDVMSDWFSWGILTFYLYTNIHPFRGGHKNYKPKDKQKQMDDGISVFHPGVKVPPSVNDFNVIPKRHLDWFKDVFLDNKRSVPPLPDSIAPLAVPSAIITIKGTDKLSVIQIGTNYPSPIISVSQFMGINYVVTIDHKVFTDKKEIRTYDKVKKLLVCPATDGTMVAAALRGEAVTFHELSSGNEIGVIRSKDMFVRNGAVYTMVSGKLVENSFTTFGNRILHTSTEIENVSQYATMYDGCLIQDLLGKKYLTLPYAKNSCFSVHVPSLDGFRIVDAKSDKNVTVVLAEKSGIYYRFIVIFSRKDYSKFEVREVKDVGYDDINFATMHNGLCILLASDTEIELFSEVNKFETLPDPPFDSDMKLFTTSDGIFFINGTSIHQLKRK